MTEVLFEQLLDQIYAAALDPAQWTAVLRLLKDELQSGASALLHLDPKRSAHFHYVVGTEASENATYARYYAHISPWSGPMVRQPDGVIAFGHELVPTVELERTEFYNDWLRPLGFGDTVGVNIRHEDGAILILTALREKRAGRYPPAVRRKLQCLWPHIERAVQINHRLSVADTLRDGLLQGLDRLHIGVILVNGDRRILFTNCVAETILRRGDGIGCFHGQLRAMKPEANESLVRQLEAAISTGLRKGKNPGGVVSLPTMSGHPLILLICASRDSMNLGYGNPAAIVFMNDPQTEVSVDHEILARLYGLTGAEARLLKALLEGKRLADYADQSGITLNTAKDYLRQLFYKTGVSRQADLMRQFLSNPLVHLVSQRETDR